MIIQANALQIPLANESVQCVVTSPPYWGLRDYGTAKWEGGSDRCDHLGPPRMSDKTTLSHPELKPRDQILAEPSRLVPRPYHSVCGKCGATRVDSQLGLEKTPEEYVENIVAVFREVRRVLKDDGTIWVNLGDTYASSGDRGNNNGSGASTMGWPNQRKETLNKVLGQKYPAVEHGLKPKDLVGIPWRVAFALQADGWYLRSDIIWAKPNPMPESVTDRPTKAHEYVFLLSKNERYYFDQEAVREPQLEASVARYQAGYNKMYDRQRFAALADNRNGKRVEAGELPTDGRNIRSVWTIATQPNSDFGYDFSQADYVGTDGKPYKVSEDCPKHGPRRGYEIRQTGEGDEQPTTFAPGTSDIANGLAQELVSESVSIPDHDEDRPIREEISEPTIESTDDRKTSDLSEGKTQNPRHTPGKIETPVCNSDSDSPLCSPTAIGRSSETRKTGRAPLTNSSYTASEEMLFRTDGIEVRPSSKQAYEDNNRAKCTCKVLMVAHFATFPEDLVKPCILAGSRPGDVVLDPFAGSATTVKVAQDFGRVGIGLDLKWNYLQLGKKRSAQHGLRL